MARLLWGDIKVDFGVSNGVFYRRGVADAWNGLVSVTVSDTEETKVSHLDGIRIENRRKLASSFSATIEALNLPKNLSELPSEDFDFSYKTKNKNGVLIHILYNLKATPMSIDRNSEPNALVDFVVECSSRPVRTANVNAVSHVVVDVTKSSESAIKALEDLLYGTEETDARIPDIDELYHLFEINATLIITDHGDGTWSAEGPDDVVGLLSPTEFFIDWASAVYIITDTYQVDSY